MNKEFARFIIIGFLSAFINYFFYVLCYKFSSNILFSSIVGYKIGILNSYIFGKKWVFKRSEDKKITSMFKFLIIYLFGGTIMAIIIKSFYILGYEYRLSWFLGMTYVVFNNFLGSKYFVFNKNKK